MDVRRDGWFGQLLLSGSASPKAHRGSIMGIIAESLKDISASRSRSEDSEIVLRLSRKPFTSDSAHQMEKAFEVESLVSSVNRIAEQLHGSMILWLCDSAN
jgi:hypothetical protein